MPDVGTQLRSYFDEVIERMTDEDVRIRATTDHGVPVPTPRFRLRPAVATTLGFGLTLMLVGVVLVLDRVLGSGVGDAASGGGRSTTPGEGLGVLWPFVPMAAGAGLITTGILWRRRHARDRRSKGGKTMHTIEKVEATGVDRDQTIKLTKRNRWLGWLAGILAVAVVGLGVWLIAEVTSSNGASLPAEVEAAIDDYLDAWQATDGEAFLAATTEDYTLMSNGSEFSRTLQASLVEMASYFRVDTVDRMVIGDGPYYVASSERVHLSAASTEGHLGQSVLTVVEVDGAWKVGQHTWLGTI